MEEFSDIPQVILLIDDEARYRRIVHELLDVPLPDGWFFLAPSTLEEARSVFQRDDVSVRVVLIDHRINSEGYQPLGPDGIDYENLLGWELAQQLSISHPGVLRIGFSKGNGMSLNDYVSFNVQGKQFLSDNSEAGERARNSFRELLLGVVGFFLDRSKLRSL